MALIVRATFVIVDQFRFVGQNFRGMVKGRFNIRSRTGKELFSRAGTPGKWTKATDRDTGPVDDRSSVRRIHHHRQPQRRALMDLILDIGRALTGQQAGDADTGQQLAGPRLLA